jgi:hypothetical protein
MRPLPLLPHELWRKIFEMATAVPGALNTDLRDPFGLASCLSWADEHRMLRSSLLTKSRIVRVCRVWYKLAIPYLYEVIIIGRGRTMASLAVALSNSARQGDTQNQVRSIGWWTKRLDLAMRDETSGINAENQQLAAIVKCLPNLAIFVNRVSHASYLYKRITASTVEALVNSCKFSLRTMRVYQSAPKFAMLAEDWKPIFDACTSLETIDSSLDFLSLPCQFPKRIRSATVSSACFERFLENPPCNLQELKYIISPHSILAELGFKKILSVVGRSLNSLNIEIETKGYLGPSSWPLASHVHPDLTRLIIKLQSVADFRFMFSLPSTILYLGIQCFKQRPSIQEVLAFFNALLAQSPSNLKVVRFIDRNTSDYLRMLFAVTLRHIANICAEKGHRLEDNDGRLLV